MKNRKGRSRFYSLPEKTALNVQVESLKHDFELARNSVVGEAIATKYNQVAATYEKTQDIKRVSPGNMLIEYQNEEFVLPLIDRDYVEDLANGMHYSNYKEMLQQKQLAILNRNLTDSCLHDLWSLVNHPKIATTSSHDSVVALLPEPKEEQDNKPGIVDPDQAEAEVKKRNIPDNIEPPEEVKEKMIDFAAGYGVQNSLADAMFSSLAKQREYLYPRTEELKPGQVIWLARSVEYKPRWGKSTADYLQPVVITLYTEDELGNPPLSRERLKQQELKRLARITSEAYLQDAVFTMVDLEMLMNRSTPYLKKLLELYKKHYHMRLPTAGTILDMGRCLTHKKEAVELFLEGNQTQNIARRLFHTTEAIDRYLDQFHKVTLLYLNDIDIYIITYILDCSTSLANEYINIVKEHNEQLPDVDMLEKQIKLNNNSYGA